MKIKKKLMSIVEKAQAEKRALTEEEKAIINQALAILAEDDEEPNPTKQEEETKSEDEVESGKTEDREEEKADEESGKTEEAKEEEPKEETKSEEPTEEETSGETSGKTEEKAEDEEPKEKRDYNNLINKKMEKRFSLMQELRSALETGKQFNLNDVEARGYSVAADGESVVQTDIYDIWEPLRSKNVLVQAGAQTITGIKNNVQIPLMGAVSCKWASETGAAEDGSSVFTNKKLSPKRITAKYPISLQLLTQDSIGVENAIRADIQKAINSKLEATLLGDAAGDENQPAGLFNGITADTISTFANITDLEAKVESENFDGGKYIMSPKAKAGLRNMAKSSKSTELVMQDGKVDGTDAFVTTHVDGKKMIYGAFENLVIATWDNVMIDVIRDTASVANGVVTIVVNAFVDAALVRPKALAFGELA